MRGVRGGAAVARMMGRGNLGSNKWDGSLVWGLEPGVADSLGKTPCIGQRQYSTPTPSSPGFHGTPGGPTRPGVLSEIEIFRQLTGSCLVSNVHGTLLRLRCFQGSTLGLLRRWREPNSLTLETKRGG